MPQSYGRKKADRTIANTVVGYDQAHPSFHLFPNVRLDRAKNSKKGKSCAFDYWLLWRNKIRLQSPHSAASIELSLSFCTCSAYRCLALYFKKSLLLRQQRRPSLLLSFAYFRWLWIISIALKLCRIESKSLLYSIGSFKMQYLSI